MISGLRKDLLFNLDVNSSVCVTYSSLSPVISLNREESWYTVIPSRFVQLCYLGEWWNGAGWDNTFRYHTNQDVRLYNSLSGETFFKNICTAVDAKNAADCPYWGSMAVFRSGCNNDNDVHRTWPEAAAAETVMAGLKQEVELSMVGNIIWINGRKEHQ